MEDVGCLLFVIYRAVLGVFNALRDWIRSSTSSFVEIRPLLMLH